MTIRTIVVLLIIVAAGVVKFGGLARPDWWGKDTVIHIATADPKLMASKARAIATIDQFLNVALNGRPGTSKHSVKIPLTDGTNTEVFWVKQISRTSDGSFTGTIDNKPELLKTVKLGQQLTFSRDQIVDWTYMDGSRMVGNFTICVLLNETTKPKLSEVKKAFGVDCSWQAI